MKKISYLVILTTFSLLLASWSILNQPKKDIMKTLDSTLYDYKIQSLDGGELDFSIFKGKKVLIVNVASKCGYTPQYKQLQELYDKYNDKLVVVGVPANNFGGQEPGNNNEIAVFCEKNYGVSFPMTTKVSVKGKDKHELFEWLTSAPNSDFTGDINWNFEKFLVDENGKLIGRFRSGISPLDDEILSKI